jgi:phosphoglycerol transferase MdoB-like AlkP superfamily enzyme
MLKKILFLMIYLLTWVVFFEIARIYFLLATNQYAQEAPALVVLKSLWYGLKMDISAAVYFTGTACVFILLGLFIPFFLRKKIYFIYTGIILFVQLLLIIADAEIFKAWGTRIDYTPLKYLATPREVWASVSHLPVFWMATGFVVFYIFFFWVFRKIISRAIVLLQNNSYRLVQMPLVLVFTGLLIIPARGGLQLSPLNQSSVYYCNYQYANNAAVNASWNFMYSMTLINQLNHNPYEYMNKAQAKAMVQSLFDAGDKTEEVLKTDSVKTNVLFILWESFTEKALNKMVDGRPVIRFFPHLMKEGIYFSNCYSSGDRTDKGISAVLSGYPALPKGSIVNYPEKTARLRGLGNLFLENGYSTHFYYGGEPEFANIKSYLAAQKFQRLTTKENFSDEDMNSKWGAHDNVVMKKLLADIPQMQPPFFTTWLTLSSHEPFETPVPPVFRGNDKEIKFLNSLHYTDSVVFSFISELKKLPLWENTLVIIAADHGHYLPITGKRADDYRVPVLWLGGALQKKNVVVEKTMNQLDMARSLSRQFHFDDTSFRFSKNVFDTTVKHWAFFTYNDGIGFNTDSSRLLFDNAGRRVVFEEGKTNKAQAEIAKALIQVLYEDFLMR